MPPAWNVTLAEAIDGTTASMTAEAAAAATRRLTLRSAAGVLSELASACPSRHIALVCDAEAAEKG
jgi:hypothetical protein